jgi:hypothetical protein
MIEFGRALDSAIESASPSRYLIARDEGLGDWAAAEERFEDFLGRAARRMGDPIFDDRSDRAAIDTWYPEARRLAAWARSDGLVFLGMEQRVQPGPIDVLIGYATDEEINLRRRYQGHGVVKMPRVQSQQLGRTHPLDGRPPDRPSYHRPQGLNPLSRRPRDRGLRWLVYVLVVGLFVAAIGFLLLIAQATR